VPERGLQCKLPNKVNNVYQAQGHLPEEMLRKFRKVEKYEEIKKMLGKI
jgi:hypothetical protein